MNGREDGGRLAREKWVHDREREGNCGLLLVKFNFDGAILPDRRAGLGLVVHDNTGMVLMVVGQSSVHWDSGGTKIATLKALKADIPPTLFAAKGAIFEGDNNNMIEYCRKCVVGGRWTWEAWGEADLDFPTGVLARDVSSRPACGQQGR
ncbi:hypothetical protein KSP40_PGU019727 [Platanthera guangdongensis]|uniref:RNase H type-1 domain-containing protein n=1 Tax=Platanthera guangdongensis TaxID=2320717 RepID=A0ABR2MBT6_9ASPA